MYIYGCIDISGNINFKKILNTSRDVVMYREYDKKRKTTMIYVQGRRSPSEDYRAENPNIERIIHNHIRERERKR